MGKFVIRQTDTGLKFDLKTPEDKVIATSQIYSSIVTCKRGISSVKACAPVANIENQTEENFPVCIHPKFEIYLDEANAYRFRLKAKNGQIIAFGPRSYQTLDACIQDIQLVKQHTIDSQTVEL